MSYFSSKGFLKEIVFSDKTDFWAFFSSLYFTVCDFLVVALFRMIVLYCKSTSISFKN